MKQLLIIFSILLSSAVFGQEELRYENRQFFQGEKEITYNEFRDIIKSSIYKPTFKPSLLDLQNLEVLKSLENKNKLLNVTVIGALTITGGLLGIIPFYIGTAINTGDIFSDVPVVETIIGMTIGGCLGLLAGVETNKKARKAVQKRFRKGDYYPTEEIRFKRIIKRYNKSISEQ